VKTMSYLLPNPSFQTIQIDFQVSAPRSNRGKRRFNRRQKGLKLFAANKHNTES
jgi:hypothetical protein